MRIMKRTEILECDRCGVVLQAYLRRTEEDLVKLCNWAMGRGTPVAVRLVKGAYWDTETMIAQQQSWGIPVWQDKASSDTAYERLTQTLLKNYQFVFPAFGSHNLRSLCHAVCAAKLLSVDPTEFELQALYGMAEPIKQAFVKRGYLVRDYAPIGELIPGMGYLVRRLLENTSNEGFLRQSFREHERAEVLLAKPTTPASDTGDHHINRNLRERFTNIPLTDFSFASERSKLEAELQQIRASVAHEPKRITPIIEGRHIESSNAIDSVSPESPELVLGQVQLASVELTQTTIKSLQRYFPTWRDTAVETRAEILFRTAELMTERRASFTALIVVETGKPSIEADADTAEAIDLLNY